MDSLFKMKNIGHLIAMEHLGKALIFLGVLLLVLGGIMLIGPNSIAMGRLPGDFIFKKGNTSFYFPLTTSVIIGLLLSLVAKLWTMFK